MGNKEKIDLYLDGPTLQEIEAFKNLSRTKNSKVQSIVKKDMNKIEKLIYLLYAQGLHRLSDQQ